VNDSPLFGKLHDLLLWLLPLTLKFPRAHRFVLAQQMQQQAFALQSHLMHAARLKPAAPWLERADVALSQLRSLARLAHELGLITPAQYEHLARLTTEVGRLLGAWIKRG
jgi:23S rRNA-intervening sequence protein